MWKCTLVLLYYLSTLLATTFISLIDSAPVNYTISAIKTTTPESNDDDASLVTTHKIVGIVGGIIGTIIVVTTFVLAVCKLRRTDFNCKCCNRLTCWTTQRYEEVSLDNLQPGTSKQEQAEPSSQPTAKQRKKEDLPVKKRSTLVGKQAVLLEEFNVETALTDVQWYNFNGPIPEDDKYQVKTQPASSKLTIKSTTVGDSGNYRCKVRNSNGEYTQIYELKVTDSEHDDVEKPLDFKDIKAKMKTQYVKKKIIEKIFGKEKYIISELPGEDQFNLDLREDEQLMELDFETERLEEEVGRNARATTYNRRSYKQIEDIITELFTENARRVVQCTANAGCGKTIFANKLVCDWFYGSDLKPDLKNIDMVIFIPIRDIDPKATLEDILGEKGLQLFDQMEAEPIVKYFKTEHEKSCIFVLDGVDEKDIPVGCDLYKLITGDICKSTKVLIMGRPEAKVFTEVLNLQHFWPNYKIEISGTTAESAMAYVKTMLYKDLSDDEMKQIKNEYTEICKDPNILTIPLYVTLIVIMLNEQITKDASFSLLKVPSTVTELFNAFLRIVIRRWDEKIRNNPNNSDITFERNPFEGETKVPQNIKDKLKTIADLSYKFLKDEKYTFSSNDLTAYSVDVEDIRKSGLFCLSGDKYSDMSEFKFFFRHKLLQEYMAALKFVHPLCTEKIDEVPVEKETFQTIFDGLSNVPKFIFGMDPIKGKEIIERLRGHILIQTNDYEPIINYEAELCNEANDKEVSTAMVQLLCNSEKKYKSSGYSTEINDSSIKFYSHLKENQGKEIENLLYNWYGLQIDSENDHDKGQLSCSSVTKKPFFNNVCFDKESNHLSIRDLSKTLTIFLQTTREMLFPREMSLALYIPKVKSVSDLLMAFPVLQKLLIHDAIGSFRFSQPKESIIPKVSIPDKFSIKHFTYCCKDTDMYSLLLQIGKLDTLSMPFVQNHHEMFSDMCKNNLGNLHTLHLVVVFGGPDMEKNISLPIESLPKLSVLSISFKHGIELELLQSIKEFTNLRKLHLYGRKELPSEAIPSFFDIIKGMNQLSEFGLGFGDISERNRQLFVKDLLKILQKQERIKTFEILYSNNEQWKEVSQFKDEMLKGGYPGMPEIKCTHVYYGYLQQADKFKTPWSDTTWNGCLRLFSI